MTLHTFSTPLVSDSFPLARLPEPHAHAAYPRHAAGIPPGIHRAGRYAVRFARDQQDLMAVQRLRFDVFNVELDEGLASSYATGLDVDHFDFNSHHLMVTDERSGAVSGTYRLMTCELSERHALYSASEFDLTALPERVFHDGAELGRACVAKEHRNGRVLQLLWRGIARYLDWNDKRYVFGCCSVPTLDAGEVAGVTAALARQGHMHRHIQAAVRPRFRSDPKDTVVARHDLALPPLFSSYLRLGAKVCGGPAFDREFGVTDYLVVLDLRDVEPRLLANLTAPGLWSSLA